MALLKAKAKAILKAEPYITKHERLVYRQCEKEAINPVVLAKCIVSLMNSRDQALAPVQFNEQNDDAITFWDVIMPWKKITNSKAYNTIGQTTDSTPESSNYIDLSPLARPTPSPFVQDRPDLKTNFKTKISKKKPYKTTQKPAAVINSNKMPLYSRRIKPMTLDFSNNNKYHLGSLDKYRLFKHFQTKQEFHQAQRRSKRAVLKGTVSMEKAAHKMSNLQKLKILKEFTEMQQHAQEFTKRINSDNSNFLRKHGFPFVYDTQKAKNLSFAEDVIDLINGYLKRANMTEMNGLSLLSPRIMPLFSKYDNDKRPGVLSPTLLSFQKDGFLSWPSILQILTGSNKIDRDAWLEVILEASGGDKALDKTLNILEKDIKEMKEKVYPTVLEMEQMESDWAHMSYLHNHKQKRSLDKYGYTFLEPKQIELAYKNRFTPSHELNLTEYANLSPYERERQLEEDIRNIAKLDKLFDQYGNYIGNRHKRQAPVTDLTPKINVLQPVAFSNRINQGLIMKANILSPNAFTTEINSLVAMVHLTLSPTAFSAAILNPAILFSRVLSPVVFRAEVLHPRILHAWVLSPTALAVRVLSPRIMQVRILSSLSMIVNVLSPGIIHPRVYAPDGPIVAILSPQIIAPRVGSSNHMIINILSPPIMADAIDEPKNSSTTTPPPWQPWG
uniref:Uncharacterized protein n=1 Tax=Acrobeloides nanus TaxID=290746 RepID=A0A914CC90_9BILA